MLSNTAYNFGCGRNDNVVEIKFLLTLLYMLVDKLIKMREMLFAIGQNVLIRNTYLIIV